MKNLWERPNRLHVLALSVLAGVAFIASMDLILIPGSAAAVVLLDYYATPPVGSPLIFPFTVQSLMLILLFIGFGEVYTRWRIAEREYALTREGLLPQHYSAVLQAHDLLAIRAKVAGRYDEEHGFLPGLIDLCVLQFQASRSVDQIVSVLNGSLELISHRLDLRYSMLRYLAWVIPTPGFIGTVIGISLALAMIDPGAAEQPLGEIAKAQGIAFNTTLVALVASAVLVLLLNLVQAREEYALNRAGHCTLVNLINRP